MTDNERVADIDNPRGYFEWEAIKQIAKETRAARRPGGRRKSDQMHFHVAAEDAGIPPYYKVIFMTRPIEGVVASQAKMVTRLATKGCDGLRTIGTRFNRTSQRDREVDE